MDLHACAIGAPLCMQGHYRLLLSWCQVVFSRTTFWVEPCIVQAYLAFTMSPRQHDVQA